MSDFTCIDHQKTHNALKDYLRKLEQLNMQKLNDEWVLEQKKIKEMQENEKKEKEEPKEPEQPSKTQCGIQVEPKEIKIQTIDQEKWILGPNLRKQIRDVIDEVRQQETGTNGIHETVLEATKEILRGGCDAGSFEIKVEVGSISGKAKPSYSILVKTTPQKYSK